MIDRREILDTAGVSSVGPHIAEKDYVLGWVLWGIFGNEKLASNWVFKGGTCLKKCFFETYRFSEDLDFTILDPSQLNARFLESTFTEVSESIYEETGIALPAEFRRFEFYKNQRGEKACQGRVGYRGPVSPRGNNAPRIKLDLSSDEHIALPPIRTRIFHPFSDELDEGIVVQCYAYEEVFAEKVRALGERTRPRDLYDVINLYRNEGIRPAANVLLDVLRSKCEFKGIDVPTLDMLDPYRPELEGSWESMLEHQVPALLPVQHFWNQLEEFFLWLFGEFKPEKLVPYSGEGGEALIRDRYLRNAVRGDAQSHLEIIRFAATNRICAELKYQGTVRIIEPYSLRRSKIGNVILHAHNVDKNAHRSYRVDRIEDARLTKRTFVPRFEIELTPTGPYQIKPSTLRRNTVRSFRNKSALDGPIYILECSRCGRQFKRKGRTTRLNRHNDAWGHLCPGRHGYLIDTIY